MVQDSCYRLYEVVMFYQMIQLSVKFGYFSVSCLSKDDVAYAIDFICIADCC